MGQEERVVQSGTYPVSTSRPQNAAVNRTTGDQVADPTPPTDPSAQQAAEPTTEPAQQSAGQQDPDLAARIAEELANRNVLNNQQQLNNAETTEDVSFEAQVEQQKSQETERANQAVADIRQQQATLQEKLENGDLNVNQYLAKMNDLNEQKNQTEREHDRKLMQLDSQLSLHQADLQNQVKSARSKFVEQNPDFVEMYNQGQIRQVLQDPHMRSVLGDNPAAAYTYLKSSALSQENEQLKQELAQIKEAQTQAVTQAAANPNARVGTQSGGMHPGNPNQQQPRTSEDGMLAAMKAMRQTSGVPA